MQGAPCGAGAETQGRAQRGERPQPQPLPLGGIGLGSSIPTGVHREGAAGRQRPALQQEAATRPEAHAPTSGLVPVLPVLDPGRVSLSGAAGGPGFEIQHQLGAWLGTGGGPVAPGGALLLHLCPFCVSLSKVQNHPTREAQCSAAPLRRGRGITQGQRPPPAPPPPSPGPRATPPCIPFCGHAGAPGPQGRSRGLAALWEPGEGRVGGRGTWRGWEGPGTRPQDDPGEGQTDSHLRRGLGHVPQAPTRTRARGPRTRHIPRSAAGGWTRAPTLHSGPPAPGDSAAA